MKSTVPHVYTDEQLAHALQVFELTPQRIQKFKRHLDDEAHLERVLAFVQNDEMKTQIQAALLPWTT